MCHSVKFNMIGIHFFQLSTFHPQLLKLDNLFSIAGAVINFEFKILKMLSLYHMEHPDSTTISLVNYNTMSRLRNDLIDICTYILVILFHS